MTKDEALKMAVEAMDEAMWENTKDTGWATLGRDYLEHLRLACIACKEALEQQEQKQKPVARVRCESKVSRPHSDVYR